MVDLAPVLAKVNSAETVGMAVAFKVGVLYMDVGLWIDHDAFCPEGVRDCIVFLVFDVADYLGDMLTAEFLVDSVARYEHFAVVLRVKDDTAAFFRIVQSNVGFHFRKQIYILGIEGVKLEVYLGALDDGIFLLTLLVVEVAEEGFEDDFHLVLVAHEIHETVFSRAIFFRQHIGVEHFAHVDNEPVEAVVPVQTDILEGGVGDVNNLHSWVAQE